MHGWMVNYYLLCSSSSFSSSQRLMHICRVFLTAQQKNYQKTLLHSQVVKRKSNNALLSIIIIILLSEQLVYSRIDKLSLLLDPFIPPILLIVIRRGNMNHTARKTFHMYTHIFPSLQLLPPTR